MGKSILILSASPRKEGNSDRLCDEFRHGAIEAGNRVEKLSLRDKKIGYCGACGACEKTRACVQRDDMADILEKMIGADVIVMATPVYFYTMAAQMKTLIDRTVARYTEISGKEFYFIATAADGERKNLERTIESLRGFTACLNDPIERGIVYGTGVWEKGSINGTSALREAYETGKRV
jgi:multimeric flavodoxin WrbA